MKGGRKLANSLIIRIDGDASGYQKELKKIKDGVGEVNKIAKGVVLGVGAVGGAVIGMGVKFNAQMEQYKAGLTTLLGDTQKANDMLADLKSFAAKTPFELGDLAAATNVLLSFGESSELVMDDLKMLGDISLGNKEKFQGLALVFGQVQSQGKLMGQDLLQMINNGFNPLQIISEKTGESISSLKDKMSKGQISFEMIADAMKTATSEGGKFYNAMETQSKTFTGQVSTLKDNINALFGEMTTDISEALSEDVLPWLIDQVEELNQAWENGELQEHIKGAAVALAAFGTAVIALNLVMFVNDIYSIVKGVKDFTAVTKAGTAAQKLFNLELIKNPYVLVGVLMTALVAGIITYYETHKEASRTIVESIKEIKKAQEDSIKTIEDTKNANIAEANTILILRDSLFEMETQLKSGALTQEEATKVQTNFKAAAEKLSETIPEITNHLYDETGAINIQRTSVEELTNAYYDMVTAKAMATAYEQKILDASTRLIEAQKLRDEAKINYTDMSAEQEAYEKGTSTKGGLDKWLGNDVSKAKTALDQAYNLVNDIENEIRGYRADYLATLNKVSNETKKTAGTVVKTAGDAQNKLEQLRKDELDNIKYAHDTGEMSDREYYKALAVYRDKYFEKGSAEWKDFTSEIYNYQKGLCEDSIDLIESLQEESLEAIENLNQTRKSIANTLKETKQDTYYTITFPFGEGIQSFSKLADVAADNKNLEDYELMLDKLFEREENLPDFILDKLNGMDYNEGMNYVSALLRASDKEFEEYISSLNEQDERVGRIADKLTKSETEKLREDIENVFGTFPEGFFDIGSESSEQFTAGFIEQIKSKMAEAKAVIESSLADISLNIQVQADTRAGVVNNYSSTYNINAPDSNSTSLLEGARRLESMNKFLGVD